MEKKGLLSSPGDLRDWREGNVEAGGHRAWVVAAGRGAPMVLLASMLVLTRSYRPVIQSLADRFRVIAVEMPGCGRGSRLERPWGIEAYADWLGRFMEYSGLSGVTVIGHSNSGPVALVAGARYPQHIARLVLADTIGADASRSLACIVLLRGVDAVLELGLTLRAWHHVVHNAVFHARNFAHQVRLSARADWLGYASRVRVPTLLAWGARDHTMPLRGAYVLQRALPDAQLYISRAGSHDWPMERPEEFAAAVARFAGRTGQALNPAER